MKKNILKVAIACVIATTVYSCKPGDFGDINISPNSPSEAVTYLLFTSAERSVSGIVSNVTPRLYTQQVSETLYTNASRYTDKLFSYSATYSGPLQDLNTIIAMNNDPVKKSTAGVLGGGTNANQIAAARILKAFFFQSMTDRWGDIPYSEALQGLAKSTPKFDKQLDIYKALFKELKEAVAQFDGATGNALKGDIIMGGSIARWKKFANTIRMNMALRLSHADAVLGKAEFNDALTAGPIASNADNTFYAYLAESANENGMYNNYEVAKRYDYTISKTIVDKLATDGDPRLAVYADPNSGGTRNGYVYGVTQAQAATYGGIGTVAIAGPNSRFGSKFRLQNSPISIFTYAEVCFTKAEAYKLGWITGAPDDVNAEAQYLAGINASLSQHGVTAPAGFLTSATIAYNPANAVEQIITQKWIANFMGYGFEAWSDWRRTGFPVLTPSPAPLSVDGKIPVRHQYSADEPSLNKANYNAVVASQGADLTSTPVWWDKP